MARKGSMLKKLQAGNEPLRNAGSGDFAGEPLGFEEVAAFAFDEGEVEMADGEVFRFDSFGEGCAEPFFGFIALEQFVKESAFGSFEPGFGGLETDRFVDVLQRVGEERGAVVGQGNFGEEFVDESAPGQIKGLVEQFADSPAGEFEVPGTDAEFQFFGGEQLFEVNRKDDFPAEIAVEAGGGEELALEFEEVGLSDGDGKEAFGLGCMTEDVASGIAQTKGEESGGVMNAGDGVGIGSEIVAREAPEVFAMPGVIMLGCVRESEGGESGMLAQA